MDEFSYGSQPDDEYDDDNDTCPEFNFTSDTLAPTPTPPEPSTPTFSISSPPDSPALSDSSSLLTPLLDEFPLPAPTIITDPWLLSPPALHDAPLLLPFPRFTAKASMPSLKEFVNVGHGTMVHAEFLSAIVPCRPEIVHVFGHD